MMSQPVLDVKPVKDVKGQPRGENKKKSLSDARLNFAKSETTRNENFNDFIEDLHALLPLAKVVLQRLKASLPAALNEDVLSESDSDSEVNFKKK